MTVEENKNAIDHRNLEEPTEKLVAVARDKYIQKWKNRRKQTIVQNTLPITLDLSIVVALSSEHENLRPLLEALPKALDDLAVEVIIVDHWSLRTDAVLEVVKDAAKTMHSPRFQIRLSDSQAGDVHSAELGIAIASGLRRTQGKHIAVVDMGQVYDLQDCAEQLRVLYDLAVARRADLVIASRSSERGGRKGMPVRLKWLARLFFSRPLRQISDPWSGFFLVRRELVTSVTLRPISQHILLELLVRCRWQQVVEVPSRGGRQGESPVPTVEKRVQWSRQAGRHMLRLWREVPAFGRSGKVSLVLLLNLLLFLSLLVGNQSFPQLLSDFSMPVFAAMAGLDFVIFNRFLFPSPTVRETAGRLIEESEEAEVDPKRKVRRGEKISRWLLRFVVVLLICVAAGWIGYTRPGALLVVAVLFVGTAIVFTQNLKREHAITMVLAVATSVATIDYVSWRFVVTNWHGWWLAGPLLFAEVLGALHGLGFQLSVWPWSQPKLEKSEDPTFFPIFIFIPTVNEGVTILRRTLEGVLAARDKYLARYPHGRVTIAVCNDGRVAKAPHWEETEALALELGVYCITRAKGGGAKAGNIEHARQFLHATGDALLVIFDADQVAKPDFLLKTIPPFRDPKMGWVQTGQYYANQDNPVSRWADDQQSMFYNLLCPGKAALNAAFICGTNVVLRAAALDQIGGLPQDSVTEDFAASILLHPSWRSIYLTEVLATGLGPLDVPSYLKQQSRWAIGTLGVLRSHWRKIFLPQKRGLRIGQRVQYFLACTHYLCGLRDLIYLISPILFIFTGIPAVGGTTIGEYLWHFLPYALISLISLWYAVRGVTGLRGIIIGFGSFPALLGSLLFVILGRKVGFAVTSKQRGGKRSPGYLSVYVFAFLLCALSLFRASRATGQQQLSLFISVLWVIYSMLLLFSFLWLNFKDMRFQKVVEALKTANETMADQPYPTKLLERRRELHPFWNLGLALLLASPVLVYNSLSPIMPFMDHPVTPFVLGADKTPYFGISVPVQLLNDRPSALERVLGTQFSIIGRTQDMINDHFDLSWANQLAAEQARPWITLQFGAFSCRSVGDLDPPGLSRNPPRSDDCSGHAVTDDWFPCASDPNFNCRYLPPIQANLPAIINGMQDQKLSQWAEDIRNYGKPVYLTILLHADRNWSVSSGVANGGIPQDVAKAWLHVQSIFRSVGANNVAWVWAPADPVHDQTYAPPAASIDAVLQDFINYPGDTWGNPETVLHDLIKHYPTKPIIVEASADGASSSELTKAAWLTQLGDAVNADPQVYALLYHEGGPGLNPDPKTMQDWSLSDPDSLAVMRHIIVVMHQRAALPH